MQKLLALHPSYLEQVQKFIASDPLAQRRYALLTALAGADNPQQPREAVGTIG